MSDVLLTVFGIVVGLGVFSGLIYFCHRIRRRPNAATRLPSYRTPLDKRWQRL